MELNRKTMQKIFLIAAGVVLLYWGLQNLQLLRQWFGAALSLLSPFLLGLCIAFILNVPMKAIEKRLPTGKKKLAGLRRAASMLLAMLGVVGVVVLVVFIVGPQLKETGETIRGSIPGFLAQMQVWSNQLAAQFPEGLQIGQTIDWNSLTNTALGFLQAGATALLNSTFSIANSVFSAVLNFVLGLVFAVYVLLQKETLARQCKRVLYAFLPEAFVDRSIYISRLSNRIFSNFLTGQCLEALILGAMFFIAMSLLGFPYALMVAVLIAFTALIPLFGAFIGCFVGTFLILVQNPMRALWFLVLFLVLQQIEGNFIYPKVVGSSVGLPGMWVLVAVTIGGSTFGVAGMLIMVPLCSVVYALLRESVGARLRRGKVPPKKYA